MDNAPSQDATPVDTAWFAPASTDVTLSTEHRVGPELSARSLQIIAAGFGAGVLGDLLLRPSPPGAGLVVWVCVVIAISAVAAKHIGAPLHPQILVPAGITVVCAAGIAWRDSAFLRALDFAFLGICAAAIAFGARSRDLRSYTIIDVPLSIVRSAWNAVSGALILLTGEINWTAFRRARVSREGQAVLRGLLIALPLVLIFGRLFVGADMRFEKLVKDLFAWNVQELLVHAIMIALWTWIVTGYLRHVFADDQQERTNNLNRPTWSSLGAIEVTVILGFLNLLFFSFVVLQFPYLFGGLKHVTDTAGLTMAEYARRGFFELATVAALVLPMLLVGHWLLRTDSAPAQRAFRTLSVSLVGVLFVIMASALQRMVLYTLSYGLTELRLYVTAFIICLALVFVWFGLSVLRGRREHFVAGALMIGVTSLLALHLINPDGLIVRTNLGRRQASVSVDLGYLSRLSADAIPDMTRTLSAIPDPKLLEAISAVGLRLDRAANKDWRSWNWGRAKASRAMSAMNRNDQLVGWYQLKKEGNLDNIIPLFKAGGIYYTTTQVGCEVPLKECPDGLEWASEPSSMEGTKIIVDSKTGACYLSVRDRMLENNAPPDYVAGEKQPMTRIEKPAWLPDTHAPSPRTNDYFVGWYQWLCPYIRCEIRKEDGKYTVTHQLFEHKSWKSQQAKELKPLSDRLGFIVPAEKHDQCFVYNPDLQRYESTQAETGNSAAALRFPLARIAAPSLPEGGAPPAAVVGIITWN